MMQSKSDKKNNNEERESYLFEKQHKNQLFRNLILCLKKPRYDSL